jgi:hypothetical protein
LQIFYQSKTSLDKKTGSLITFTFFQKKPKPLLSSALYYAQGINFFDDHSPLFEQFQLKSALFKQHRHIPFPQKQIPSSKSPNSPSPFRWNTNHCRSEYDPITCATNRTIADYFNVKILTEDHLNEYKKQFFIGPKINFTVCSEADMSVQSPVREFWDHRILGISSGVHEMGSLRYDLALYLFIVWVICYLCIFKGREEFGGKFFCWLKLFFLNLNSFA